MITKLVKRKTYISKKRPGNGRFQKLDPKIVDPQNYYSQKVIPKIDVYILKDFMNYGLKPFCLPLATPFLFVYKFDILVLSFCLYIFCEK